MCLPRCIRLGSAEPEGRTSSRDPKEPKQPKKKRGGTNQAETLRAFSGIEPRSFSALLPFSSPVSYQKQLEGKKWEEDRRSLPVCLERPFKTPLRSWSSARSRGTLLTVEGTWTGKGFDRLLNVTRWSRSYEGGRRISSTFRNWLLESAGRGSAIVAIHCIPWINIWDPPEFLKKYISTHIKLSLLHFRLEWQY